MDKELTDAIKALTDAVTNLTEAIDLNSSKQSDMYKRQIIMGDYISSLTHGIDELKKSIDKKI
jgi:hypothetical protein